MTVHLEAVAYQPNWWPILTSAFMGNALIGGTIVALAAGLIGYFVVVRQTAFAAHALALPAGKRRQPPAGDLGGLDGGQRLVDLPSLGRGAAPKRPPASGEPEQYHVGCADGFP